MEKILKALSPEEQATFKSYCTERLPEGERSQLWGYNIMPGFSAEAAKYAYEEWDVKSSDIFLASFPKTGTNFINAILRRILYPSKEETEIFDSLPMQYAMIEVGTGKKFKLLDKLPLKNRLFTTHLPADLVNMERIKKANAKVVVILRNPKDQMVSWLKYSQKLPTSQMEPWKSMIQSGWNKYFDHVVAGDFDLGTKPGEWYPEHILSWYKHLDNKTVYFIYFEDLKMNPVDEIKKLAKFLERPLSEEQAQKIAEDTSFEKMKQEIAGLENKMLQMFLSINMRKGGVGGWKEYFTVSQSEMIDKMMEEKLKDTDIKFIYE